MDRATQRLFVAALIWSALSLLLHLLLGLSASLAAAAASLGGRLRMGWQKCALSRTTALHALLKLPTVVLVVQ
jgi:hypothetical protein